MAVGGMELRQLRGTRCIPSKCFRTHRIISSLGGPRLVCELIFSTRWAGVPSKGRVDG